MGIAKGIGVSALAALLAGCIADGFDHTLVMSGTACGLEIEYTSKGDVPLGVYRDDAGELRGVVVGDSEAFDTDDEQQWRAYARTHDLYAALWFEDSDDSDSGEVLTLEEGVIGARDLGTLTLVDHSDGERVAIDNIDFERREIVLRLNLPIRGHNANYPPEPLDFVQCVDDVIIGSIVGSFELREVARH